MAWRLVEDVDLRARGHGVVERGHCGCLEGDGEILLLLFALVC